ncbi:MAG TPA: hypothetical protein ACFYD6_00095 [Candidatus Brocadiia bacterium]|nr:hypothetical protein [Candidatus Brocadiales bacterium]
MTIKKTYANVSWIVDDVIENSRQFGIRITRDDAKKVLVHEERRIADAMVEAGWGVIEYALLRRQK